MPYKIGLLGIDVQMGQCFVPVCLKRLFSVASIDKVQTQRSVDEEKEWVEMTFSSYDLIKPSLFLR